MSDQDVILRLTIEDDAMKKAAGGAELAAKKFRELDAAQRAAASSVTGAGRASADAFKQVERATVGVGRSSDQMTRKLVQELKAVQAEASKLGRELVDLRGKYDALHRSANSGGGMGARGFSAAGKLTKMGVAAGGTMAAQYVSEAGSNMEGMVGGATRATGSIAGGAAAGFMVGGPWGALAGGALGALGAIEDITIAFGGMTEAASKAEEALNNARHAQNVAAEANSKDVRFNRRLQKADAAEEIARMRDAAEAAFGMGDDPTSQAMAINQGSRRRLQDRFDAISNSEVMGANHFGTNPFKEGVKEQAMLAKELKNLEEERLQLTIRQASEAVKGGQMALALAEQQVDVARRAATAAQNQFLSGQERFGQLSRGEQKEFMRLDQKLAGGQGLSEAESRRAKSLGVDSNALAELDRKRGADFAQTATGAKLAANQRAAEKAEQQAIQVQGTVKLELGKLEFKLTESKEEFYQRMIPVLEKMHEAGLKAAMYEDEKLLSRFNKNGRAGMG